MEEKISNTNVEVASVTERVSTLWVVDVMLSGLRVRTDALPET
jgi:hypothetical protein